jgi:hypothetical protein
MKYSQLKSFFLASTVTVSATKTLLTFNTATNEVRLPWSSNEKGLKGKPTREWVAIFDSTQLPVVANDGDIIEVIPLKDSGEIKIKLLSSSEQDIYISCQFIDGRGGAEDLLWSTEPLTDEEDAQWFRTHHGATKLEIEIHGESLLFLSKYKDSGLLGVRLPKAKPSGKTATTIKGERIVFSPENIPLKVMKGELKLYRFSNNIQFSFRNGDEVVSYRTPILESISGKTLDHFKILAKGDIMECPKGFGKRLTTLVHDMTTGNKANFSMKMEDGVLTIGKDGICLIAPEKEAAASVVFALKKLKKMMELVPSFPKRIGISFPDRLVGVNTEGLKIPEYLIITLIDDDIVDKFDDKLNYCNSFLFNCVVKDPYKLYGVETVTERNKERVISSAKEKVGETAKTGKQILDAIASKVATAEEPPFDVANENKLTPEYLQEKMQELEAFKQNAIAPLNRAMDLRAFKAQKVVIQAYDLEGRMLEIVYSVEGQALAFGYYDNTTVVD